MKLAIALIVLFQLLAWAPWAQAQSLEAMDAVVLKAKNLKEFLSRKELIDEYFEAAATYYGREKFQRVSYDKILEQMRKLSDKIPGFADRLWETTDLGDLVQVATASKSYGRRLSASEWTKFRVDWTSLLIGKESGIDNAKVSEYVKNLKARTDEFDRKLAAENLPRKARERKAREFYEAIKAEPELEQAAAWVTAGTLETHRFGGLSSDNTADIVLGLVEKLRQNPRTLFETLGITGEIPGVLLSQAQKQMPTTQDLLAREDIFPKITVATRKGTKEIGTTGFATYDFVPIPRRFHGVFEGIALGECVGGGCGHIVNLTPERWAVIALKGSQRYHVEKNGNYLGFVGLTPVKSEALKKEPSKTYATVDLASPTLNQNIVVNVPGTTDTRTTTLFDAWVTEELAAKPKEWDGLVIGESHAIANAGVLETARSSLPYTFGKKVGESKTFTHIDPMAKAIVTNSPKIGYSYGGRMIFEGFTPNSGNLTKLAPVDTSVLTDPEKLQELLKTASDDHLKKIIPKVASSVMSDPDFRSTFANFILTRDADSALVFSAIDALSTTNPKGSDSELIDRLILLAMSDLPHSAQARALLARWSDRDLAAKRLMAGSTVVKTAIRGYLAGDPVSERAKEFLEVVMFKTFQIRGSDYLKEAVDDLKSSSPEVRLRGLSFLAKASKDPVDESINQNLLISFVLDPEMGTKALADVIGILHQRKEDLHPANFQDLLTWLASREPTQIEPAVQNILKLYRNENSVPDSIALSLLNSSRDEVVVEALKSLSFERERLPKAVFDELTYLALSDSKSVRDATKEFIENRILRSNIHSSEFLLFIRNYPRLSAPIQKAVRNRIEGYGEVNTFTAYTLENIFRNATDNETKERYLEFIPARDYSDGVNDFLANSSKIAGIEKTAQRTLQRIKNYARCKTALKASIAFAIGGAVIFGGYGYYRAYERQQEQNAKDKEKDREWWEQHDREMQERRRREYDEYPQREPGPDGTYPKQVPHYPPVKGQP